eukprot:CAMPEP_0180558700 /NCGR_PEP_ID=MMETSP1037_2-20121125/1882_1 /TAXON_ID=632150 /ORGANISM="Azadinium spinosum, Strain 3D9" /LENGTH=123 /DNA_ID=CAMNT_0022575081 /DNA_START=163 /DNA_END=535 /DNA_ORIENTATION=+
MGSLPAAMLVPPHRDPAAVQTLLCLSLTFLPEALMRFGGASWAPLAAGAETIAVRVEGMGCEACQVHVQSLMGKIGGVLTSRVDFRTGRGEIFVKSGLEAFDFREMVRRLGEEGFMVKMTAKN